MKHMYDLPSARYMSVGAHYAWSTQSRRRGPAWATDNGLEWFFRLVYEPRRMWRRYVVGLPEVVLRMAQWYWRKPRAQAPAGGIMKRSIRKNLQA